MAPDRPDGADVENGRAIGPAASSTGPVVTRVFGFCDALNLREPTEQLVPPPAAHFVEGPALAGDEVVIEEESVVPIIKHEQLQQQGQEEKPGQSDDELTSLSWLHQQNLLKGLEISEQPGGGGGGGGRNIKREHLAGEDSLDVSENTNSVSSLDDSYSHESNGHNSSVDSLTVLNYDEVVINGLSGQGNAVQDGSSSPDGTTGPKLIGNHNNNNNNANANFNLPVPNRNKHPTHIPYDPYLHKNCKPPYSFSSLIFMAIEDSPVKALPVKEVYAWILEHFPYFRNAPTGWKNSVRHNLSLNKCFRKVEKSPHLGKGSLWMVDAQYRPNLIQALSRTPCPPPTVLNMSPQEKICATRNVNVVNGVSNSNSNNNNNNNNSSSYNNNNNNNNNNNSHNNHNNNNNNISKSITTGSRLPDPVLFPYLSKRLASSSLDENSTEAIEFDSDVDAAAAAMLAFKHGPIILNHTKVERKRKPSTEKKMQVITRNSNEDHTYSLVTSVRLERREVCHDVNDVDEQRKIAEGADALLNLAGVTTTPPRDPLAVDPIHIQQREEDEEEEDEGYEDMSLLYGTNKNVPRYIPGSDPLEVRPVKRRSSGSKDGPNKRRKRFWREPWTENGRYPKQVRG